MIWPFDHAFFTYGWPGPFGWIARETPGNLVAGFLQVGLGFALGLGAHKLGVFEHLKQWATRELHGRVDDLHARHDTNEQAHADLQVTIASLEAEIKLQSHSLAEILDAVHFPPPALPVAENPPGS